MGKGEKYLCRKRHGKAGRSPSGLCLCAAPEIRALWHGIMGVPHGCPYAGH